MKTSRGDLYKCKRKLLKMFSKITCATLSKKHLTNKTDVFHTDGTRSLVFLNLIVCCPKENKRCRVIFFKGSITLANIDKQFD